MARAGRHTVKGMVGTESYFDRADNDFYPTPPDVTTAILDFLKPSPNSTLIDPACGTGDMDFVFKHFGYRTKPSDLNDMGYGETGVDFLSMGKVSRESTIITNPPFVLAEQFIRHGITLGAAAFVLVLKATYWHAKGRVELFKEHQPSYVCPLTWRPAFLEDERGGSPIMEVQVCIWERGDYGDAYYQPLERPEIVPSYTREVLMAKNFVARRKLNTLLSALGESI